MIFKVTKTGQSLPINRQLSLSLEALFNETPWIDVDCDFVCQDTGCSEKVSLHIFKRCLEFVSVESPEESMWLVKFLEQIKRREKIVMINIEKSGNSRNLNNWCLFEKEQFVQYYKSLASGMDLERGIFFPLILSSAKDSTLDAYEMEVLKTCVKIWKYTSGKKELVKKFSDFVDAEGFMNGFLRGAGTVDM